MVGERRGDGVDSLLWTRRASEQPVASLKRWVLVGVGACFALALAYLPPRGAKPSGRESLFLAQSPRGTPARQRAQAVADEWRAADGSLRLLRVRRQLQQLVRQATATSLVVVSESSDVATAPPPIADSAIHLAWRQLGLEIGRASCRER